jgi:integrase
MVRLLLLTGQRRTEVAALQWRELKEKGTLWVIPASRTKNGLEHHLPLSQAAQAIVAKAPRIAHCEYLFTTNGTRPVSGYSGAKARLDALMLEIARDDARKAGQDPEAVALPAWRLHDLRRSVASNLARLGINLPVIEKVLNHTSGSFAGIVGVYQRHSFSQEKAQALEAWARYVDTLVSGEPASNVVPLRGA